VERDQILLTQHGSARSKYVELTVDGSELTRRWWAGTGKPQERTKSFASEHGAREAMEKAVTEKMRAGYALIRDTAATDPGDVVFQCMTRAENGVVTPALHPQGHTLAVAFGLPRRNGFSPGAEVHTIDLRTGVRREVHTDPSSRAQIRIVAFEPDGDHLTFTVSDYGVVAASNTVDLATGHLHREPHVLPHWDAARKRVLVIDGDLRKVLGPDGDVRLERPRGEQFLTVGALSPSGRLMAVAHGTNDKQGPVRLEIWDVDSGRQVLDGPIPFPPGYTGISRTFDKLAFDGSEQILVLWGSASSCFGISVETGDLCWEIVAKESPDQLSFEDVALSPDGTRVVGIRHGGPAIMHDIATGQALEPHFAVPGGWTGWYQGVAFSADGTLLAIADYPGRVTVFKVDGVTFHKSAV
jgi:predicted DNA-binding WGR domain protein/WD40 repeat protein